MAAAQDLMKRPQAAKRLGIHPETLKKLVAGRKVFFTRPPGTRLVLFSEKDIADTLAMWRVEPGRTGVAAGGRRA